MLASRRSLTKTLSYAFAALAVSFFLVMIASFVWQSLPVFRHQGMGYLTGTKWFYRGGQFGALSMIYGTVVVAAIALLVALPIGIGAALFSAEIAPPRLRLFIKVTIELLAGVPSVVYGLLGVWLLRDWVYRVLARFEPLSGDTLLTAGLLLSIMVLPTVMTLCDDALSSVPSDQRVAARGLGMTRSEVILAVSLPQASPGIFAAVLLSLGRALGETIAVFLVIGRQDNQWPQKLLSLRPLIEAGQSLTSKLGGSETNIAYGDSLHWAAIVGLGLILLALSATITWLGVWLRGFNRFGKGQHA